MAYDFTFKLVVVGDSDVGKNHLIVRFADKIPQGGSFSFPERNLDLDGKKIKIQIWDTAGHERFNTLSPLYYRKTNGVMLVYDVTNEKSFEYIRNWLRHFGKFFSSDVEKIIVGNNCDMDDKRMVSKEKGEQLALEHSTKFMEASAQANINVEEAFLTLTQDMKARMNNKIGYASAQVPLTKTESKCNIQ